MKNKLFQIGLGIVLVVSGALATTIEVPEDAGAFHPKVLLVASLFVGGAFFIIRQIRRSMFSVGAKEDEATDQT